TAGQSARETARRPKPGWSDSDALFQGRLGEADILGDDLRWRFSGDQPGRTPKSELNLAGTLGEHIDMIVRVIPDRVPLADDLAKPADVFLLHRLSKREEMDDSAACLDPSRGLDRIPLRRGVEVPLLVVPVSVVPRRKVSAHLQVERDGDQGSVARR